MKTNRLLMVFAAAGMSLCAWGASAKDYIASTYLNPQTPLGKGGYVLFPEAVKKATKGEITFNVHHSAALLPFRAHLGGIRDGVAQVGQIAGTYTPADIPLQQVFADMAFAFPDPRVIAFASTEINMTNKRVLAEWSKNNVVFGGGYSTPAYILICRDVVKTLADIKGKKTRTAGAAWDRVIRALGGVPVNVPSSEMYTGLDSGNLDCATNGADTLKTFSLWEVAKSANTVKLGLYFSGWLWGYNKDFWKDLRPDQRRLLFDIMAEHVVKTTVLYQQSENEALAEAPKKGMQILAPSAELQKAVDDFAAKDVMTVEKLAKETHGVANPRELINEFNQVLGKWTKLLKDVDRLDEATMTKMLKREVYDKLDEKTYGLK
jgi:TRAP-type transport system periplasmic protein